MVEAILLSTQKKKKGRGEVGLNRLTERRCTLGSPEEADPQAVHS